ncbi:hypothetical protein HYT74_01035 [Candidatus Daviesbacteria bacterium]|nr:hypothetical protein [Candidatus Daviesbacteria bacterium]
MFQNTLKKHFLFFLLIPIVIFSQLYILAPHLKFGLIDLDNGELYDFRELRSKYPDNIQFLIESYKLWGAYSHQYYYLGLLNFFFGANFESYHQVTHVLKIIATITAYPLFFVISGSSLAAFLASIVFAFSPSAAGSLESVIHGITYGAIIAFNIFLSLYIYFVKNRVSKFSLVLVGFVFLLLALAFSPIKLYPTVMLILIVELLWLSRNRSKSNLVISIKRALILLSPLLFFFVFKPAENEIGAFNKLWIHIVSLIESLSMGRLDHLLIPFVALSTTVLPVTIPLTMLIIFAALLAGILSKRILKFCLVVFLTTTAGGILTYLFSIGHSGLAINQAIAGFFLLGLAFAFLIEWLSNEQVLSSGNKNQLYLGLFFGPLVAFFYIVNIWSGSGELDLFFAGVHRYVSVPSIFTSLFWGTLIAILYKFILQKSKLKLLSFLPFLLLIPVIFLSIKEINKWYDYSFAIGFGEEDKIYMRSQLNPYFQNLNLDNPRLIYIDIYSDQENTQYYGNTIVAGFNVWPIWLPNINFRGELVPYLTTDFKVLSSSVTRVGDQKGIQYFQTLYKRSVFYKPENFYAILLKSKKVIDITDQVKLELGL